MTHGQKKGMIQPLLIIILLLLAIFYVYGTNNIKNIFDGTPDADCFGTTCTAPTKVTIAGKDYTLSTDFCSTTTTMQYCTPKTTTYATCTAEWDLFTGHCTQNVCENKYLEVCGSGTGEPVQQACTDSQQIQLTGTATIVNGKLFVSNYGIVLQELVVNAPTMTQNLFTNGARIRIQLYSSETNRLADTFEKTVDITKFSSEIIPYQLDYTIPNVDCMETTLDDHTMKMVVTLFDENGATISTDSFTIGQNNGQPIKAGW